MNYNENHNTGKEAESNHDELREMFAHDEIKEDKASKNMTSTDNKVLVKQMPDGNRANNEGGYGSVLGVILVIVAISFILTALLIRMML